MSEADADVVTAFHEAGHAVAALALGRPVHKVTILPDRDFLGSCAFGKPVVRPSEDWLEREMLIALAGAAAEARHTGRPDWQAAARDRDYAAGLAAQRAGDARRGERLLNRTFSKAEHLLDQGHNWPAVEKIAAELVRLKTISGRAARHLYEEAARGRG